MGHARALINIEDPESQLYLLRVILDKNLSVRDVEKIVRNLQSHPLKKLRKVPVSLPLKYQKIGEELSEKLATSVELRRNNKGKGSIVIPFKDDDDLFRLIAALEK
jgi:ParB family chromosome partitioning protein